MDEELNPSILGSYDYWNNLYNTEIENFKDHGDVGEIWFGQDTARRIIKWISEKCTIQKDLCILDLGCGNGMLLIDLHKKGFTNLHGVDYSQNAIDLATAISETEKCNINFFVGDVLDTNFPSSTVLYDIVLDKGTYDAISLAEESKSKRKSYTENLFKVLKENGSFIITSCNWTEPELIQQFSDFFHIETLPAPVFKFGGKSGKTVTSVVFQKQAKATR